MAGWPGEPRPRTASGGRARARSAPSTRQRSAWVVFRARHRWRRARVPCAPARGGRPTAHGKRPAAVLRQGSTGARGGVGEPAAPRCPPRMAEEGVGASAGQAGAHNPANAAHAAALAPAYMCAGAGAAEGQTGLAIAVVSRGPVRRWRPRGRLRRRHRGRPHGAHCGVARGRRARAITRGPSW